MCVVNLNECYCSCHHDPNVVHMMPCCQSCPECGENKITNMYSHNPNCIAKILITEYFAMPNFKEV